MSDEEKILFREIQELVVVPSLNRLAADRMLSDTAIRLNTKKQRLSELKSGKRELTFYYLSVLIQGGVVSIEEILKKKPMDSLTKQQRVVILQLIADPEILELLYEAQQAGLPVKDLIRVTLKRS